MADEMDVDVDQPKTKGKKEGKESGKPRFEVKKVREREAAFTRPPSQRWVSGELIICVIGSGTLSRFGHGVSCRCVVVAWALIYAVMLRHRRRQLRHLQEPYYGSVYVFPILYGRIHRLTFNIQLT